MSLLFALLLSTAFAEGPWWNDLGDPGLVEAIDIGLAGNGDVSAAAERARAAKAAAHQARGALMPTAAATFSSSTAPFDTLGFQFGGGFGPPRDDTPDVYHTGSYGLSASWDVDLFGRSYTAQRASYLDADAAAADTDNAAMTLASRIAATWYDLVAIEQRMAIVRQQIAAQERTLEVTELRFGGGEATGLDVLQARQQLASTRTFLPTLNMSRRLLEQQLAVLLGRNPGAELPGRPAELPVPPAITDEADAESLAESRPDLIAAEERVRANKARKRAAYLGLTPAVKLTAATGNQFADFGEYSTQKFWNVGTQATLPLFSGGRTMEQVRSARAGELAAEHTLAQLRRTALAEVEGARARDEEQRNYIAALEQQLEAATLAHDAARQRYKAGSVPYINVLTAANAELGAQLSMVQAKRDLLGIHMDLRDASAGAWAEDLGERAVR